MNFRRKVVGLESVTVDTELKRKEKHYKHGGSTVILTIERHTAIHVKLECGHFRQQHSGMRDITKAKHLECYSCAMEANAEDIAAALPPVPEEKG